MKVSHKRKIIVLLAVAVLIIGAFAFLLRPIEKASATVLIQDTFDDGDHTDWGEDNAGTYTNEVSSGGAIQGSYGQNCSTTGNSAKSLIYQYHDEAATVVTDFYLRLDTLNVYPFGGDFSTMIYSARNSSETELYVIRIMQNGTGYFWQVGFITAPAWYYFSNSTPTEGNTYHITAEMGVGASATFSFSINSTELASTTLDTSAYGGVSRHFFGVQGSNDPGIVQSYSFDSIVIATSLSDLTTVPQVTINAPTNTTYASTTISVDISAISPLGTMDTIWYNLKNGTDWVYVSNVTYTATTVMTNIVNGTSYAFYAYANNTLGEENSTSVMFSVAAPAPSPYEPLYNADMKLQVVGNSTFMPNDTQVILRGVNKNGNFEDDPDGVWLGVTDWSDANVEAELDEMQDLGVNFLRVVGSVYGWELETVGGDENSAIGQREALQKLTNMSAERGIWVLYSGYRTGDYFHDNNTAYESLPYPPYTNNTYINSEAEFVAWCADVAAEMKDYGNFLFEPWNEPEGGTAAAWFIVVQDLIDDMRAVNYTQPIVVQWGVASWINIDFPTRAQGSNPMDWIATSGLTDVQGNLIYSNHQYRNHIQNPSEEYYFAFNYTEIYEGLDYMMLFDNAANYAIMWGEIGADTDWNGEDWVREAAYFNNSLSILNSTGVHLAGWTWRSSAAQGYELINADFSLTDGGIIFFGYLDVPPPEENTYTLTITIILPENTTYSTSSVAYSVTSAGNDTLSGWQINSYFANGTAVGTNKTAATGSFTSLVNGTYTFGAKASGVHGSTDYDTLQYTVAVVTSDYVLPVVDVSNLWTYLYEGDFIGFFNVALLNVFNFQSLVVAVLYMLFFVPLYIRTKSLMLLCIIWVLLGSFLIIAMPDVAAFAILFMALGIGGLLYRLFRPSTTG